MAPCVAFGSQRVTADSRTPYTDATQTKKNKPNYVKRPMNAFMVWSQMRRKATLGSSHHAEISKKLGQEWKTLSEEEKKPFYEEASRLRKLHNIEFPTYKYQPKKKADPLNRITSSGRVTKKTKAYHRTANQSETKLRVSVDIELTGLSNPSVNAQNPVPGYMPESPESLCSSAGLKTSPAWSEISSRSPSLTSCGGSTTLKDHHTHDFNVLFDLMENGSTDQNSSGTPDFKVVEQKPFDQNNSFHTPPSSPILSVVGNPTCQGLSPAAQSHTSPVSQHLSSVTKHHSSSVTQQHAAINQINRGYQQPVHSAATTNPSPATISMQSTDVFNGPSQSNAHSRGAYQSSDQVSDDFEFIACNVKAEPGTSVQEMKPGPSVAASPTESLNNLSGNQVLNVAPSQIVKRNETTLGTPRSMSLTVVRNQMPFSSTCPVQSNAQMQYPTFSSAKVEPDLITANLQNSGNQFPNIKVDISSSICDSSPPIPSSLPASINDIPMQVPSSLHCDMFGSVENLNESLSTIELPTPDLDFATCPDIPIQAPVLSVSDVDEYLGGFSEPTPVFSRFFDSAFFEQCSDMFNRDPLLGSAAFCAMHS